MPCVRKFLVVKKLMDKKGGGEYQIFPCKIFRLTVPENFLGQTFRLSLFRVSKNFMLQKVMSQLSVDFFCLKVPRIFVGKPFCAVFQKVSGSE